MSKCNIMEGFCRGCLIKYDPTELLQYTEKNRRLFVYSTGLQVKRNDNFLFQLCKECYLNMKVASKFKKLCRTSDKKFKQYLALKETDDSLDFCTFLKNNDNSLTFRFPVNGSSTPVHLKNRDEDNESTCTSIRNFMNDFLHDEEIPDSEARIIREVIEEEADVLDDTLDSHWLQDDISIDSDFRLDFSFSPFSTPRTVNNDCYNTPKKIEEQARITQNYFNAKKNFERTTPPIESYDISTQLGKGGKFKLGNGKIQIENGNYDKIQEEKQDLVEIVSGEVVNKCNNIITNLNIPQCIIDKNLEKALEDENNKEFSLEDLLRSPSVHSGKLKAVSPTITNILFGKKLEINDDNSTSNAIVGGQCIEQFNNVESDVDILKDFFMKVDVKIETVEDTEKNALKDIANKPLEDKSQTTPFHCETCNRKFRGSRNLKLHIYRVHKRNCIIVKKRLLCDMCGRAFTHKRDIIRHLQVHMKQKHVECSFCKLPFDHETSLQRHMATHTGMHMTTHTRTTKKMDNKKFVCSTCGAVFGTSSNFRLHQRRHNKEYAVTCKECGVGFYRTSDLQVHMRNHTGERPFQCTYCNRTFARRDTLNKHLKCHTGETLKCHLCGSRYTTKYDMRNHLEKCKKMQEHRAENKSISIEQSSVENIVNFDHEFVKPAPVDK